MIIEKHHKNDDREYGSKLSGPAAQEHRMYLFLLKALLASGCEVTRYGAQPQGDGTVNLDFEVVGRTDNLEHFKQIIATWVPA